MTIASGLRGLLEARQRFDLVNLVRVPASALMYLGPAAVLPFSRHLAPAVAVLVAVRILACVGYGWCAARVEPALLRAAGRPAAAWRDVAGTGAWLTVANLASTSVGVLDRLVLGALLPVAAVAYYATPLEAVTKALVIPAALTAVMFPAFSAERDDGSLRLGDYLRRSVRYTFLLLFPVTLAVAALAPEVLSLWLGAEFAASGAAATRWLSLGVLANGLALTPSVFLQARGAAARVAVLQAVEVPLFAGMLAMAALRAGVTGAAAAWCARAAADFWCLSVLARRAAPGVPKKAWGGVGVSAAVGASFLGVAVIEPVGVRLALLAVVLAVAGSVAWRTSDSAEREATAVLWSRLRVSGPRRDRPEGR
jgi:O-antigen/teichoic acid export membrane protein